MKHKVKLFNNGSDISPSEKFRYHLFFVAFLCCALASFELLAFFISSEFHDNIIYTRTWCDVVRETKKPAHSVRCCWTSEKLWTLWIFIKCMCLNDVLILTVQDVYEYASGVGLRRAAARHRQEIINMETTQKIFEPHFHREKGVIRDDFSSRSAGSIFRCSLNSANLSCLAVHWRCQSCRSQII